MHTLQIAAQPDNCNGAVTVGWALSPTRQGRLRVVVEGFDGHERFIVAELRALLFLLCMENVAGEHRSGKGLTLVVTQGAIKKLHRRQSDRKHLAREASRLVQQFSDAVIKIDKKVRFTESLQNTETPPLVCAEDSVEVIDTPRIGPLILGYHAIKRYQQRMKIAHFNDAYKRLKSVVQRNSITHMQPDNDQKIRYNNAELYQVIVKGETLVLVVSPNSPAPKLSTCYFQD